jgi:Xaa-Pro aminopeptidase
VNAEAWEAIRQNNTTATRFWHIGEVTERVADVAQVVLEVI